MGAIWLVIYLLVIISTAKGGHHDSRARESDVVAEQRNAQFAVAILKVSVPAVLSPENQPDPINNIRTAKARATTEDQDQFKRHLGDDSDNYRIGIIEAKQKVVQTNETLTTTNAPSTTGRCDTNNGGCQMTCHVQGDGTAKCSCPDGYQLAHDSKSCIDEDECSWPLGACEFDDQCINTPGSFLCLAGAVELEPDCTVNNGGCQIACSMVDVTNGSRVAKCHCTTGLTLDADGKSCSDMDECKLTVCLEEEYCVNTYGSYVCLDNEPKMQAQASQHDQSGVLMRHEVMVAILVWAGGMTLLVPGMLVCIYSLKYNEKRHDHSKYKFLSNKGELCVGTLSKEPKQVPNYSTMSGPALGQIVHPTQVSYRMSNDHVGQQTGHQIQSTSQQYRGGQSEYMGIVDGHTNVQNDFTGEHNGQVPMQNQQVRVQAADVGHGNVNVNHEGPNVGIARDATSPRGRQSNGNSRTPNARTSQGRTIPSQGHTPEPVPDYPIANRSPTDGHRAASQPSPVRFPETFDELCGISPSRRDSQAAAQHVSPHKDSQIEYGPTNWNRDQVNNIVY